jgi:hypothetical protein
LEPYHNEDRFASDLFVWSIMTASWKPCQEHFQVN